MGKIIQFPSPDSPDRILLAYKNQDYPRLAAGWTALQAALLHLDGLRLDGDCGIAWPAHQMIAPALTPEPEQAMVTVKGQLDPSGREDAAAAIDHLTQATMGREKVAAIGGTRAVLLDRVHRATTSYLFKIDSLETQALVDQEIPVQRPAPELDRAAVEAQVATEGLEFATTLFRARTDTAAASMEEMTAMLATVPHLRG